MLNPFFRQYLRHHFRHFSLVVTVKIMAAQTGFPAFLLDQDDMWDINRIIVQSGILVTVLTNARRDADPYAQVLLVATHTELHGHCLPGRGEFGFHKLGHRMPIIRIFVTRQTLLITCWLIDKGCRGI